MTTHDEQARELVEQYLAHPARRPALSLGEKMDLRVRISAALAASHLAGWRAAREAAADEAEAACHCNGNIGDAIRALPDRVPAPTFDLVAHLRRQRAFSERTFGPGARTKGVCDHIRKELAEIEAAPADITEWIDVVLLALDGAWRSGADPVAIVAALDAKQTKNEARSWPDWRTMSPDKAIEHNRTAPTDPERAARQATPPEVLKRARRWVANADRIKRNLSREPATTEDREIVALSRALLATHAALVEAERRRATEHDDATKAINCVSDALEIAVADEKAAKDRATAAEADAAGLKSAVALAVEEMDDPCRQIGGGRVHFSDPCMAGLRAALSATEAGDGH